MHCDCNHVDSDDSEKEEPDKNDAADKEAGTNHQVATDARMVGGDDADGDSYGDSDDDEADVGGRGDGRVGAGGMVRSAAPGRGQGHGVIAGGGLVGGDETDRTDKDLVEAIRFDHNDKDDKGEIELKTKS